MQQIIEKAWSNRALLKEENVQETIREVISLLDKGEIRIAEKINGNWEVNEWIKKAVILYFPIQQMHTMEMPPFEFHDKMELKRNCKSEALN